MWVNPISAPAASSRLHQALTWAKPEEASVSACGAEAGGCHMWLWHAHRRKARARRSVRRFRRPYPNCLPLRRHRNPPVENFIFLVLGDRSGTAWFSICFLFLFLFLFFNPPERTERTGEEAVSRSAEQQRWCAEIPHHGRQHHRSGAWWSVVSLWGPKLMSASPLKVKGMSEKKCKSLTAHLWFWSSC